MIAGAGSRTRQVKEGQGLEQRLEGREGQEGQAGRTKALASLPVGSHPDIIVVD